MDTVQTQYPPAPPFPTLSITPNTPDAAIANFVCCVVFWVLAISSVTLRTMARIKRGRKFFLSDLFVYIAILCCSIQAVGTIVTALYGCIGQHMDVIVSLAPERLTPMLKLFIVDQIAWAIANTCVRVSMILFYLEIFSTSKAFRIAAHTINAFATAYVIMVILVAFLICRPVEFNWLPTLPGGKCGDQLSAYLASGVINLCLDAAVVALPLPMLWRLQMGVRKKLELTAMFSMGLIVVGTSVARTVSLSKLDPSDLFFNMVHVSIYSFLEPALSISVACIPASRPIVVSAYQSLSSIQGSTIWSRGTRGGSSRKSSKTDGSIAEESFIQPNSSKGRDGQFSRLYNHLYPLQDTANSTQCRTVDEPDRKMGSDGQIVVEDSWAIRSETAPARNAV